jgi:integrase
LSVRESCSQPQIHSTISCSCWPGRGTVQTEAYDTLEVKLLANSRQSETLQRGPNFGHAPCARASCLLERRRAFSEDGLPCEAWWKAYRKLATNKDESPEPGTVATLIAAYKASTEWEALSKRTSGERVRHLKRIEGLWGDLKVAGIEPWHVLEFRDMHKETPAEANNLVISLSAAIGWSVPRGWRSDNPCLYVKKLKIGEGWRPWSWDDIEYFRKHAWKRMWEAAGLSLYTGQRQSDVLSMQWTHLEGGLIRVKQGKTNKRLAIAMHRDLKALLERLPRAGKSVLTNSRGAPWTQDGFKASWQNQMAEKVLAPLREKGLVFHGLRKSAVVFLLEAGCTDAEVAAITGQSREMIAHYAREVNQRHLAAAAVLKWEADGRNEDRRRSVPGTRNASQRPKRGKG